MVTSDDIEDFYTKEIEHADKDYLEDLKNNKDRKDSENRYLKRLSLSKKEYEKRYLSYLKDQKEKLEKNRREDKREVLSEKKEFKVERLDLSLTRKERFEIRWELLRFKWNIKIKNFLHNRVPVFLKIAYLKTRLRYKILISSLKDFFENMSESIKDFFKYLGARIKDSFIKLKNLIKRFFLWIFARFKKKEPEKPKETIDKMPVKETED
jgi:hypothetical protein